MSWSISIGKEIISMVPRGVAGSWDAVETKEGDGWRLVWKIDEPQVEDPIENGVRVSLVRAT